MISKRYKNFKNFGKCLEISNGNIKALVTVEVGPRVIYYGYKGFNIMREDIERVGGRDDAEMGRVYGDGEKWLLYGGHRIWKAPEDIFTYSPDNYPVKVDRTAAGAKFTPRANDAAGIQAEMEVEMQEDGGLNICQRLTNIGQKPVEIALWGLTVLRTGGAEIIPLNRTDTGLLPNQNFVWWPYNDFKDKRFSIDGEYGFAMLKQNRKQERAFKIGIYNTENWAAYAHSGHILLMRYDKIDGKFADMHCNFESYTNAHMLEMEALSPLYNLENGQSAQFNQSFKLYKDKKIDLADGGAVAKLLQEIGARK